MRKILLSLTLSFILAGGLFAQDINNAFFDKVSYLGAFNGVTNWTSGWTEWNPVSKVYADATSTKGNGQFSRSAGVHITASETWSGVIKLDGWVYVDNGATLTISAGTVIRGTEKSVLVIERGAKIMAVGTSTSPIVFTSNKGAGLRANSDWGGLVICGKAINNIAGGEGTAEGGIESKYGGTVANDDSGELKYVRIEFPGYEVATGKEVNGLTLCSVGSATKINYVQVSYSGDDGYEWFGGSVNAKYLISYKTEDDDFDTDNGYNGMIQYGLISRDPEIAEIDDAANGFESDNDASGSGALPFTSAIFSNISAFGPAKSATEPATLKTNHAGGSALRLRRNTKLQIYNSAFMGWGMGLRLESDGSQTAANTDVLTIKNTIISGIRGDKFKEDGTVFDAASLQAWFLTATRENQLITNNADVKITDPYNYTALNFQPAAGSLALNASLWYDASQNTGVSSIDNSFFDHVSYTGAFNGVTNWTTGWTEWNPISKVYADATATKGNGQFSRSAGVHITTSETWSGVIKLDGWVYVDEGATLTIAAGTVIRGTEKSVLVIERGAKIMAVGTSTSPIVFTSNKGAGLRSNSDWAGLVICGKAINNIAGGEGTAEGGIESKYGGSVADDNSGELKYVRIEFPGYEVATGKEVNGLTLCSVGSGTKINYVQVSYSGDDGYEWFGGSVNAKYLISYKTEDDDFDTDNGYNGMIQYGLISRDPEIAEIDDAANGFESDNDASGSGALPFTSAIFSNISAFGPAKSATEPAILKTNHAGGSALRLRRNTKLQIYNSAFMGWGMGLRLESDGSQTAANTDVLTIKNTIISGIRGDKFKEDGTVFDAASLQAWFLTASRENQLITNNADVKITDPYNYTALNFQPAAGSMALNASFWYDASQNSGVASIDNSFFDQVRYVGAFDGVTNWTAGWTEWNPISKVYAAATVTKGNGQFSRSAGVHITANETWNGVIKLDGWVYVEDGATLTIAAGTVIRGTEKSVLVIERGAKIMAVGTSTNPIVFTSNKGAGLRANSDWGGVVICGKAINNIAGGEGTAEGGIESKYGGTVADDNSGELKYVRIEFPGYEVATGKEVNGLTLCSVGSATKINYVQVSYSGDDGYEWFGGSVNAKYLISYKTEDDDFDTDNGYNGMIQFGLISRDPEIAEVDDAANGFESDNDSSGSGALPFTSAIFSNISAFGPAKSATEPTTLKTNHAGGSALRLRRNTKLQIYNSAFMGWGMGLRLESDGSQTAANTDLLTVKNTIISGIRGDKFKEDGTVFDAASLQAWFLTASRENMLIVNNADVKITDPYNYTALNFQPAAGSMVLNASYWIPTATSPVVISNETALVNYPNPFIGITNIELQLGKASYVRVSVIDMAGRTVSTLQEGNLTEGKHRFVFNGTALPKGLYFAKVVNGNNQKVVKMISK